MKISYVTFAVTSILLAAAPLAIAHEGGEHGVIAVLHFLGSAHHFGGAAIATLTAAIVLRLFVNARRSDSRG